MVTVLSLAHHAQADVYLAVGIENHSLHRIHKGALHFVEYYNSDTQQHQHKRKRVTQHPPLVAAYAQHAVLEKLNDTGQRIQLHKEQQLRIANGRERIDNRGRVHPKAHEER